jgi:serine/threonine-protein kinase RsbW
MKNKGVKLFVPSSLQNLSLIRAFAKTFLELEKVEGKDIAQLLSVIDELSTNVVEHGYCYKPGDIIIEIKKDNDVVYLVVEDNGVGFDEEKESKEEGGMGLYLARALADDFQMEKKVNGTIFRVQKKVREVK